MKTCLIALCVIFLIACSAKKNIPVATESIFSEADVTRASAKFPGVTADQLISGKKLYEGNCGGCHGLKKVENYTEEQWRKINPDMARKARIDAETELSILKYVVTMAKPS